MCALQVINVSVSTLGVVVPLEVRGESLSRAVTHAWRDCLVEPGRVDEPGSRTIAPITVGVGGWGTAEVAGADLDEVLHRLRMAVSEAATAAQAGNLVLLNAGAVADADSGATAVLVAPAGAGLTTAMTTLGTSLVHVADGVVGITADGLVMRSSMTGSIATLTSFPLTALWILERDPAHTGEPHVEPLATIDALAALAAEARSLGRLTTPLQRLADIIRRAGGVRHVRYAEAATILPAIQQSLGR